MIRITKLVSSVLLSIAVASCSNNSDSATVESSNIFTVTVTEIELENIDNGQIVPVDGEPISGQVLIED